MKSSRLITALLLAAAAAILLVASGMLDLRISFGTRDAEAIDLFGSEEKEQETSAEPFWKARLSCNRQPPDQDHRRRG